MLIVDDEQNEYSEVPESESEDDDKDEMTGEDDKKEYNNDKKEIVDAGKPSGLKKHDEKSSE